MAQPYPVMLEMTGRLAVIVGGGQVAARKAAGLAEAGAMVRAISPVFSESFPPGVERVIRCYQPGDLKGAKLVFAATDSPTVNDAVALEARALDIWCNRADASDLLPGDFSTPAKFQSGAVVVTVSAGSAALTAMVRDQLAERFDPVWTEMADAMKKLRPFLKSTQPDPQRRAALFRALATPAALDVLRQSGMDGLQNWISQK